MSLTAEMAALSEQYSWKNFTTFARTASAKITLKTVAIAQTGWAGTHDAIPRTVAMCQGSGGSVSGSERWSAVVTSARLTAGSARRSRVAETGASPGMASMRSQ